MENHMMIYVEVKTMFPRFVMRYLDKLGVELYEEKDGLLVAFTTLEQAYQIVNKYNRGGRPMVTTEEIR